MQRKEYFFWWWPGGNYVCVCIHKTDFVVLMYASLLHVKKETVTLTFFLKWETYHLHFLIYCRVVESCFSFFQFMFVCVDALCLFLPGIGRIRWLKKGRKILLNTYGVITVHIPFSVLNSDGTNYRFGRTMLGCICLCSRLHICICTSRWSEYKIHGMYTGIKEVGYLVF